MDGYVWWWLSLAEYSFPSDELLPGIICKFLFIAFVWFLPRLIFAYTTAFLLWVCLPLRCFRSIGIWTMNSPQEPYCSRSYSSVGIVLDLLIEIYFGRNSCSVFSKLLLNLHTFFFSYYYLVWFLSSCCLILCPYFWWANAFRSCPRLFTAQLCDFLFIPFQVFPFSLSCVKEILWLQMSENMMAVFVVCWSFYLLV